MNNLNLRLSVLSIWWQSYKLRLPKVLWCSAILRLIKVGEAYSFATSMIALVTLLPSASYADHTADLITKAQQTNLSAHPTWLKLIHYKTAPLLGGYKSQVDSKDFFLASDGKYNPEAELKATLEQIYSSDTSNCDNHAICKFPARTHWLTEMLDIDRNSLPQCVCTRFTQWVEAINPKKVTLIFPSSFMNRPSSMFGHTLLRLDSENSEPILSYVANFSAHTTNDNSLLYAAKGLAGGYPGVFAVQPYYESIKKYTDIENRDLWEFPLNLSPKEIQFLMMHLWELNSAYFDYYYFDENCSYHLLSLIEVIRPELELTEEYYLWAIPIDTARTVLNNIESTTPIFRPSQVSKIKAQAEHLSDDELALAQQIAEKKATTAELSEINPEKKARVLETAYDFLQFLRLKNEDESIDMDLSYHLLKERSAIEIKTPATVPTPTIRPDQGHGTSRVAASFGTFNDSLLAQYQFRAAYHDILDNHGGYLQGAEIRIFEFVVEQKETEQIKLESLTPVKILSLSPHDDLFGSTSWGLDANIERVYLNSDVDTLAGKFTGNAGTSWSFFSESTIAYGLFGLTAKYSGVIEDNIAIGPDFTAGVASSLTENLKLAPEFKVGSYLTSDKNTNFSLSLTSRYSINRNFALGVTISRNHEFDYFYTKALGQVFYYY